MKYDFIMRKFKMNNIIVFLFLVKMKVSQILRFKKKYRLWVNQTWINVFTSITLIVHEPSLKTFFIIFLSVIGKILAFTQNSEVYVKIIDL